ncbi:hypothetical protein [Sinomonas halotolerans]|uniref:Uncharacterized protein n=1 Tax=Sinomonas halotolerans TaxID=1644133 RepID=A0ABU9X077_9MICC
MIWPPVPRVPRPMRLALLVLLAFLCAAGFAIARPPVTAVAAEQDPQTLEGAGPATSSDMGSLTDPTPTPTPTPSPEPTPTGTVEPSPAPIQAEASLTRVRCDLMQLDAAGSAGKTLAYRVTDEAGRVAASGTFTGALGRSVSISTGHSYTARVSESTGGPAVAVSEPADMRAPCPVVVTPDAPAFSDECGTAADTVEVPRIIGIDYRVGSSVLVPGGNSAVGNVTVVATARPGYMLSGTSEWSHDFSDEACAPGREPVQAPGTPSPPPAAAPGPTPAPWTSSPAFPSSTAAVPEDERFTSRPASEANGIGGPGPLAWGIMLALAAAGGVFLWSKTRHH